VGDAGLPSVGRGCPTNSLGAGCSIFVLCTALFTAAVGEVWTRVWVGPVTTLLLFVSQLLRLRAGDETVTAMQRHRGFGHPGTGTSEHLQRAALPCQHGQVLAGLVVARFGLLGPQFPLVGHSVALVGDELPSVGLAVTVVSAAVTVVSAAVTVVSVAVALVGGQLAFVGLAVPLVGDQLAFVGLAVAFVGGQFSFVDRLFALLDAPLTRLELLDPRPKLADGGLLTLLLHTISMCLDRGGVTVAAFEAVDPRPELACGLRSHRRWMRHPQRTSKGPATWWHPA
jgi:hypothetical protein